MSNFIVLAYAERGYRDEVLYLINSSDNEASNDSVAIAAAKRGYLAIVEDMIYRGIDNPDRVAMESARTGRVKIVDRMIDIGATDMDSIISGFVYGGYIDVAMSYIEKYKYIDLDSIAYTAARRGYMDILEYLISLGASDYDHMAYGAAEEGRYDVLLYLMDHGLSDYDVLVDVARDSGYEGTARALESMSI